MLPLLRATCRSVPSSLLSALRPDSLLVELPPPHPECGGFPYPLYG
jgi:hypothetical protein